MGSDNLFSVYVGNLDKSTTTADLIELFCKFGSPKKLHIADRSGSYTYGFVRYTMRESAVEAILQMNGTVFKGRRLLVELSSDSKLVHEINRQIKDMKSGKEAEVPEKTNSSVEKLVALKRAVKEHNLRVGQGPRIDCYSLLDDIHTMSVKLPPSIQDSFAFKGHIYLAELAAAHKDESKRVGIRVTPLVQCAEVRELGLRWLPVCKVDKVDPMRSKTDMIGSTDACKVGTSLPAAPIVPLPEPSLKSLPEHCLRSQTNNLKSPSPKTVSQTTNMPDLVIGHESCTSGYASTSSNSADESTMPKLETTTDKLDSLHRNNPYSAPRCTKVPAHRPQHCHVVGIPRHPPPCGMPSYTPPTKPCYMPACSSRPSFVPVPSNYINHPHIPPGMFFHTHHQNWAVGPNRSHMLPRPRRFIHGDVAAVPQANSHRLPPVSAKLPAASNTVTAHSGRGRYLLQGLQD